MPTTPSAQDSTSGARDAHTERRLPGASSSRGAPAAGKDPVSIRRTVGAAEPDGRWWQYAGLASRRAGWVASLALIAAGLVTLWQLLFAGSPGGDVWLGRDWEPPIQHRSEGSTSAPTAAEPDDCAVRQTDSVEPGEDSGGGSDNSGSGSDDSCSQAQPDDDNSGSDSGRDDDSHSGGDDDSESSPVPSDDDDFEPSPAPSDDDDDFEPSPAPTEDDDSEGDDNSGPGSGGDDSGGGDNSGPGGDNSGPGGDNSGSGGGGGSDDTSPLRSSDDGG
ncbi:MAG: hypothetical protein M3313_10780 [Actinomycetota bacterium]|nr:hypothetical protein [Actinomycetota bacterium]